ncbi:hypothetical protein U472_03430 [Orenia metallireducens]|uniref:Glycosyltransferase 2-like domain-containing protein n=1 Tax=Orenia metallireducens TaxID=1413210 RepID=A0A1C0AB75_9FIRM|nr:glycosyltransferase [Orenia metallireducens]OCL27616.1 hypothetical protein U472_03430 [Orenia metallireducens]
MPEISVLMSVYNGEEFIEESIKSVLNQTFSDFEFIIIDDCSTDNTVEIIQSFIDNRIKLYTLDKNVGVGAALKFGLAKTSGIYIAKADSDDINHPTRFIKQKNFLDNHLDIDMVKTLIEYFPHDEEVKNTARYLSMKNIKEEQLNQVKTPEQISKMLYWWCCIPHNSIMVRSSVIKKIGYGDIRLGEDYKLFYELNKLGHKIDTIEEKLVKFRVRASSITATMAHQKEYIDLIYHMKKNELDKFLKNSDSLYIWGTGNLGKLVFEKLKEKGYEVSGFIDGIPEKQGNILYDMRIFSPDILKESNKNIKVIVCAQPARLKIANFLENLKYKDLKDFFVYA